MPKIITIPKGAYIRVELSNPISFELSSDSSQDAIELHTAEAIRNNGDVTLTGGIHLMVEEDNG